MDVAWYRGPQRSPPPSQRLENFVPGIQAFIEKHGTRINQPGGKLIRVSVEFAYQWPRHENHRKRGVAQVSRCNIDKWRRLANSDILRLCFVSFVLLSLARPFFSLRGPESGLQTMRRETSATRISVRYYSVEKSTKRDLERVTFWSFLIEWLLRRGTWSFLVVCYKVISSSRSNPVIYSNLFRFESAWRARSNR